MRKLETSGGWGVLLFCLPLVVLGHHARFEFDETELLEVQGQIVSVFWRNPHIQFSIDVITDSGTEERWLIEGSSINRLERLGISEDILSIGSEVTILGFLSRREAQRLLPVQMTLESGRKAVMTLAPAKRYGLVAEDAPDNSTINSEQIEAATARANGIFRVWVVESRSGGTPELPLTAAARAAKEAWVQPEDRAWQCEPPTMLENMSSPYPIDFIDGGDEITLRMEQWDGVRTIYLNRSIDSADPSAMRMGYSVGRWEGRTLIVETKNIVAGYFDDLGTPQSDAATVLEHFTLSEDETRLDLDATLVDSEVFTEPLVLQTQHFVWTPGEEVKPFNCSSPNRGQSR